MADIKIHAGSWDGEKAYFRAFDNMLVIETQKKGDYFLASNMVGMPLSDVESLDIATEETVKKLSGTVGWGVAGAAILGPVGLLAGLLIGGKKKQVTFVVKFKNGKKMLASTDNKTFTKLQAATF